MEKRPEGRFKFNGIVPNLPAPASFFPEIKIGGQLL
jgi:hypothetical protein